MKQGRHYSRAVEAKEGFLNGGVLRTTILYFLATSQSQTEDNFDRLVYIIINSSTTPNTTMRAQLEPILQSVNIFKHLGDIRRTLQDLFISR